MAKYINPYTDFGFKKLFGEEGSKNLLKDFLNQLLPAHHQIEDLAFQNVEQFPDTNEERKAFFDIHCVSTQGERFIVEMQKAKIDYFKDRVNYYLTYPIREQAQRGEWNFQLQRIYFIAILDFYYEAKETAEFYRYVCDKDQFNKVFDDKIVKIYLQMPAFQKQLSELTNHFDKWAYFLKHLETFEDIPHILNEPVFNQAFKVAELANLSANQRADYEKSRLSYIGIKQVTETALREGFEKGIELGIEKGVELGIEKGIEKGVELGIEKGIEQSKTEAVLGLHANNIPVAIIAKSLNLTEDNVNAIIENSKKNR